MQIPLKKHPSRFLRVTLRLQFMVEIKNKWRFYALIGGQKKVTT